MIARVWHAAGLSYFHVDPNDTISTFKSKIGDKLGLSDDEMGQRLLVFDDRDLFELDGSTLTLESCGVKKMDMLVLLLKESFFISVKTRSPRSNFSIEVADCYETISHLKEKIQQKIGIKICVENFPAKYMSADDDRTLLSLGLYHTSSLGLPQHKIYLNPDNIPFGETIDLVLDVPNFIRRFQFSCRTSDEIHSLKSCALHGFDEPLPPGFEYVQNGRVVMFFNGKRLEDESFSVEECGIKDLDFIQYFESSSFPILVTLPFNGIPVVTNVRCFYTIGMLKSKLQRLTGIPKEEQHIMYKDWRLDDEGRRLLEYGIKKGLKCRKPSKITSSKLARKIYVLRNNSTHKLRASRKKTPHSTPGEEKLVIHPTSLYGCRTKPYSKTYIKLDLYRGDGCFSSTEELNQLSLPSKIQVSIEIPNMPWRFPLDVNPRETIGTMREAIMGKYYHRHAELFGQRYIEEGRFVLSLGTNKLADESVTLDGYGIKHMDSIQLVENAPLKISTNGCGCRTKTPYIEMSCLDTVGMLKEKLQETFGIPKEKLHVGYFDELLFYVLYMGDENRRLVDYGIANPVEYDDAIVRMNSKNELFWNQEKNVKHGIIVATTKHQLNDIFVDDYD